MAVAWRGGATDNADTGHGGHSTMDTVATHQCPCADSTVLGAAGSTPGGSRTCGPVHETVESGTHHSSCKFGVGIGLDAAVDVPHR